MEKLIYFISGLFIGLILMGFALFHLPQVVAWMGTFSDYIVKTVNHSCNPPEGYTCTKIN